MIDDRIPEPKGVIELLDTLHRARERMPIDRLVAHIKAGTEETNRDAVLLVRAERALKDHVQAELTKSSVTDSLNPIIPRLRSLLAFRMSDDHAREFLYAIYTARNINDADRLLGARVKWGGPFSQVFGEGDNSMWQHFLAEEPGHQRKIVAQLHGEFPDEQEFIKRCASTPEMPWSPTVNSETHRKILERFLELTFTHIKDVLDSSAAGADPSE